MLQFQNIGWQKIMNLGGQNFKKINEGPLPWQIAIFM